MTADKLLPCPFCGGEAEESVGRKGEQPWRYIECIVCSAMADPDVWNRRHTAHAVDRGLMAEARAAIQERCDALDYMSDETAELLKRLDAALAQQGAETKEGREG